MVAPPELIGVPELIRVLLRIEAEVIELTQCNLPFPLAQRGGFPAVDAG
jgi:hypothetical protein